MTYDPEKPLWSIMTKSHGGTVSVVRGLTLREARQTYERLDPCYGLSETQFVIDTEDGFSASCGGGRQVHDGDIDIREVFGPEGWTGFAPAEVRLWPHVMSIYCDKDWNILPAKHQDHPELAEHHKWLRGQATAEAME